jgi:hypothetical protein
MKPEMDREETLGVPLNFPSLEQRESRKGRGKGQERKEWGLVGP